MVASLQSLAQEMDEIAREASSVLEDPARILSAEPGAFARIAARTVPRWHFAMLNDGERNSALVAALKRRVPAGASVLDIGSGSGLLAMAAVRAGAGRVYTCEANPLLAEIARQTIAAHGMSGTVTVLAKRSDALRVGVDLDRPVDVLVSEIVDCGLIGEGLLPAFRDARERLLAPGGVLIPSAARLYGRLVRSEAVAALNQVGKADEFDVSLMNALATRGHFPVRLNTWPHAMVSETVRLLDLDLRRDALEPGERAVSLTATGDGEAHALAVWFELDLGGGMVLRNSPADSGSHWMQGVIPFAEPVPTKVGEPVSFRLRWSDTRLSIR
ncbi:methyltransferase domain-containing protein [Actinomadura rubrisoli]|uniref:Methyltransferase domain-containing protein n=2 Tax=Actinomadura rubrisoli TaxID=2530368 RepID=A0A4R5C961_9ACTN|nr:methyltransferase domain-containing protein [Actinomadura rubrisoli]